MFLFFLLKNTLNDLCMFFHMMNLDSVYLINHNWLTEMFKSDVFALYYDIAEQQNLK